MGSSVSEAQKALLTAHFREVILMLDGDATGRKAAEAIAPRFAGSVFVRICNVPEGKQPDELSSEEIQKPLSGL